jgi:thiol:disulfide interchange protein DsbG
VKQRGWLAALAAACVLAACKDAPAPQSPTASAASAAATVSLDEIAKEGQGFSVGSTMSTRTVYVFFDPQCPHCAALWAAAKPLKSQARFVWLPVGVLNAKSTEQGAALLAAPDPVAAMDQHEASLRDKGGIAGGGGDAQKEAVKRNTAMMTRYGFASVPTVVAKHAGSGELLTIEGSMPTDVLAKRLGLQAP